MITLDEILAHKKKEIKQKRSDIPFEKLRAYVLNHPVEKKNFVSAISIPKLGDIGLIAEIKIASPSSGLLVGEDDGLKRATLYEYAGADAISVVVDRKFFHGDPSLISHLQEDITLPILCKDFVIDEYQIFEAKSVGADALLLIVKILKKEQLLSFIEIIRTLGMEPVVEVNTLEELNIALATDAQCIAVNARNLTDFSVDISDACEVLSAVPKERVAIGFSGIQKRSDVDRYKQAGAKAVLVGTKLMKSFDVVAMIKDLKKI